MMPTDFVSGEELCRLFAEAVEFLYRQELPVFDELLATVARVNASCEADSAPLLGRTGGLARVNAERHVVIRLGTAQELSITARAMKLMGLEPIGYYDLSLDGYPLHSTSFRSLDPEVHGRTPFRVFVSLLRADLITDRELRAEIAETLSSREVFAGPVLELIEKAEGQGGLALADARALAVKFANTLKFRREATVSLGLLERLYDVHRLLADIVAFSSPRINHLTLRTLDMEALVLALGGLPNGPTGPIKGTPHRDCPVLVRQTGFVAVEVPVLCEGIATDRTCIRVAEIEERGAALTRAGRARYEQFLAERRRKLHSAESAAAEKALFDQFLPDDWDALRRQGLVHFQYAATEAGKAARGRLPTEHLGTLVEQGYVTADPIVYEDFLPAGSGRHPPPIRFAEAGTSSGSRALEEALGTVINDDIAYYEALETESLVQTGNDLALRLGPQ